MFQKIKKNNFKYIKNKNGYAILETLFYIAFLTVLSVVVINSMIVMIKSYHETKIGNELMEGSAIMERMSREVRKAYGINTISSNDLKLDTKDGSGVNENIEFKLVGSDIQILETNKTTVNLNTTTLAITGLSFTQITSAKGKAVKIVLTIKSTNDTQNRTYDFYDTVALRGGY